MFNFFDKIEDFHRQVFQHHERQIARMFDHETVNITPRPGEARISLANNQKLRKTFGWEPSMKLEDWLAAQL